jgi:Rrf2 family protein
MLSHTCKTAIKAVIYLASKKKEEKAGLREVALFIEASEHTVGKILQLLAKENIICSTKGPSGGFFISEKQKDHPILKIVEAIDGPDLFRQCGLGLSKCSATHPCPIHDQYKAVRDGFERLCRENRVADLCLPVNSGYAYLIG